jgi:hypothetical protein
MKNYKYILLPILFSFVTSMTLAQDLIVKRDAEEIEARVEEITDTHVKYHKFNNLEGPIYSVAKSDVLMIKYANGEKDVFKAEPTNQYQRRGGSARAFNQQEQGIMSLRHGDYYIDNRPLSYRETLEYVAPYPEVDRMLRKARDMHIAGSIVMYTGVAAVLAGTIVMSASDDPFTGMIMTLSGCGVALVGTGVYLGSIRPYREVPTMYNNAVSRDYAYSGATISLAPTRGGLGLQLTF